MEELNLYFTDETTCSSDDLMSYLDILGIFA